MRVDTVSVVPRTHRTHGTNSQCPDVRLRRATRCPGHTEDMLLLYAVRLNSADVGAALRSYQITGDAPLAETLRTLVEATLTSMLHRGTVGLRADALTAAGDIEVGRAHND